MKGTFKFISKKDDNVMTNNKNDKQTIHKTKHRNLKSEQRELHKTGIVLRCSDESRK